MILAKTKGLSFSGIQSHFKIGNAIKTSRYVFLSTSKPVCSSRQKKRFSDEYFHISAKLLSWLQYVWGNAEKIWFWYRNKLMEDNLTYVHSTTPVLIFFSTIYTYNTSRMVMLAYSWVSIDPPKRHYKSSLKSMFWNNSL